MERHLASNIKVYDPLVKHIIVDKNIATQYYDFDMFINEVDMIVIMVAHNEIIKNMKKLERKIVLDTRKICELPGTYRL
jgi:UDP-N-acetyl-D-mannosaminuronic acid dehydrogenase